VRVRIGVKTVVRPLSCRIADVICDLDDGKQIRAKRVR
jgi:hypothetical protein